ncbi:MAG: 6,7-dimethyl-8-ribityllumazine synthase, partial [Rhodobacteraceae bacterium]|nr:6,7-dimethyl-8-ribityllumazine synthase [Paracoccaceae bacterium]
MKTASRKKAKTTKISARILIIEARFYDEIADDLLDGATLALKAAGAKYDVLSVPGILEIPATAMFAFAPKSRGRKKYDGFVALGCAVKGETDHYEYVCRESMAGVTRVCLDLGVAAGNGILTCPNRTLAEMRADPRGPDDVGGRAARACMRMIE